MYWDGAAKPAVDVPFGDFFCAGIQSPVAFQSALFANPEGRSFISYIAMPFKKGARITLTNESGIDLPLLFYDIDFVITPAPPPDMLYFHASWTRKTTNVPGTDLEILPRVTGTGRFLGTHVCVNVDSVYEDTWWGEGEVKMYIDGDQALPTINGTGAEDYTGTGWGLGRFLQNYQGCTIADGKAKQYAFYRFHLPDPVYFHSDIRVTLQEIGGGTEEAVRALQAKNVKLVPVSVSGKQFTRLMDVPGKVKTFDSLTGWVNFYRSDDYACTAYFYLDQPADNLPALAAVAQRVP